VAVADLNGDGRPDVVVANANSNNATVLLTVPGSLTATISGSAIEGRTLTASSVTTGSDEPLTITYQWQSASSASGTWSNISGATGSTYVVQETDETKFLRVQETFTDDTGQSAVAGNRGGDRDFADADNYGWH
jgi:hypothetical protein